MAKLHIPGVSIAVVHNGVIEWARGYGVKELGGSPVTADTLFQAGSISKPVATLAALRLVQNGKLSLDSDVNAFLTSWKIPPSPAAPGAIVTLRELLTHTAGFTVHGFPGYAANEPVPTLVQVLNGEPPANTPPIRLESVPGSKWNYSGGGFTVMQQAVLDVSKEPFPKLLHDTVLVPIGMSNSTYQQPLPGDLRPQAAMPYTANGTAVAGGPHTYPEMAAAGLWTTPSDLAHYLIEVQQSLVGHANHVLSQELTRQMLTPGKGDWGLGLQIGGAASNRYFSHGGVNEGYESLFAAYEQGGDGAVIMTNAQGGSRLTSEVMSSIAAVYDWPDFRPVVRTEIKLAPAALARYVGTYELTPQFSIAFTLEGDQLMTQATNQPKVPIYPESDRKFFLKVVNAELEFFSDDKGQVSYLILHQNGHDIKGKRRE
jgi:CubicO group peptidase (beta-lactamase class C family)